MILIVIASFFLCQILGDLIPDANLEDTLQKHPWLASIRYGGIHACSGSVLSTSIVLTTAQCVNNTVLGLSVQVGRSLASYGSSRHKVALIKCNGTCQDSLPNDLALLKVTPPFEFGKTVFRVDLSNATSLSTAKTPTADPRTAKASISNNKASTAPANTDVIVAGWTPLPGRSGYELRTTSLRIVQNAKCTKKLKSGGTSGLLEGQMCVDGDQEEICKGYYGSPLVKDNIQVGLVPWTQDCSSDTRSNFKIYVDIVHYYDWIVKYSKLLESVNENATFLGTYILPAFWPLIIVD